MAKNVAECRQMIDACRSIGVRLMIAYRKYFEPAAHDLRQLIRSGKLGPLRIIHTAFSIYLRPESRIPRWHFDRQLAGGGGLPDVGIYCINTVRYLTGKEPLEAEAYQWTVAPSVFREVDEHIAFRLNFPDGLVMQATSSWGAASSSFLRVIGEKGYATLDPAFEYDEVRRLYGKVGKRWFDKKYKVINELALELDALAGAARGNRDVEPTGAVGLRDVAIMEAIYQAAREGHAVPCAPA